MTEESSSAGGQAPTSGLPQAGISAQPPQAGSGQAKPAYSFNSLEEATSFAERQLEEKRKANEEAKRVKSEAQAQADNLMKMQQRLEQLEAQTQAARERAASSEVKALAKALGFRNPDFVLGAIRSQLKLDNDGVPTNAKDLLDALAASDAYLLESAGQPNTPQGQSQATPAPRQSIGASNPSRSQTSGAFVPSWETIPKLTRAQFDELNVDGSLTKWMLEHPIRPYR